MRRSIHLSAALAVATLMVSLAGPASAALRPCLAGHKVTVSHGRATMVVKGRTVACAVVKAAPKPSATSTPTPASTNPPIGVLVRFAGDAMNSLTVHAGLTVTLRNADAVTHTLVIASEGITVTVPANDISAFLAPGKPGRYVMTTSENPAISAVLVVVP